MDKTIVGENVLTVLFSKPQENEEIKKRVFFCPYTKNITVTYQGKVNAIIPGYDPTDTPQVMIRPQRMPHGYNIQYTFKETNTAGENVDFWIQDQYFVEEAVKTYFCFNCQAPQLYFSRTKAVFFNTKADIKAGTSYNCSNPYCKQPLMFLGIVAIKEIAN